MKSYTPDWHARWRRPPVMRILIGAACPRCGAGWLAFYEHCPLCVLREAEVCRG